MERKQRMGKASRKRSKREKVTPRIRGSRGRRVKDEHIINFKKRCWFGELVGLLEELQGRQQTLAFYLLEHFSIWILSPLEVECSV